MAAALSIIGYLEQVILSHPSNAVPNKYVRAMTTNENRNLEKRWALIQDYLDSRARFLQSTENPVDNNTII